METLIRYVKIRTGVAEYKVIFPFRKIRQKDVELFVFNYGRMDTKESFRVRTHVDTFREVVSFFLGILSLPRHVCLALMDVVGNPRCEIVDLRKPA